MAGGGGERRSGERGWESGRARSGEKERTNEQAYHTDFGRRVQVILHLGRQETWPTCSSIEAGMEENAEGARKPNF